jgi:hypothetical protein
LSPARLFVIVIAGAALGACAGPTPDGHLDVVFDVCAPITVTAPGVDAARAAAIEQGLASWRERGVGSLTFGAIDEVAGIEIRFEDAAPAFHGYYDDELGVIYLNTALVDRDQLAVTVAHELGHAFGLWHVSSDERTSVMNPGNLWTAPTHDDATALVELWGACAPVLGYKARSC